MFGYIVVNRQEMKFREYDRYHACYCGLCRNLRKRYGRIGQMTLSFDMTFLVLLLDGLYEPEKNTGTCRCSAHPLRSHAFCESPFTDYAADMNLLLSYDKALDDWMDERKIIGRAAAAFLRKKKERVCQIYPEKSAKIQKQLEWIRRSEHNRETDPDLVSGLFGEIMAEIFAVRQDEWEGLLRQTGFYLGKFIYLMDAFEDMPKDRKSGSYNVFLLKRDAFDSEEDFAQYAYAMLRTMMASCSRAFEKLPIIEDVEILRNILYSGVWYRYEMLQRKKDKNHA